jgi:hypothetical protein
MRITNRQIANAVANRQDFKANSASGQTYTYSPSTGRLSETESQKLLQAFNEAGRPLYVVHSYATPIAWELPDGSLYATPEKFSVTTSKTQNYVRQGANA